MEQEQTVDDAKLVNCNNRNKLKPLEAAMTTFRSVSYTHLDVYKRQVS